MSTLRARQELDRTKDQLSELKEKRKQKLDLEIRLDQLKVDECVYVLGLMCMVLVFPADGVCFYPRMWVMSQHGHILLLQPDCEFDI